MSNASKGKTYEREAKQAYESMGYIVEQAIPKTVFVGPGRVMCIAHDFFGFWDLICKKVDETVWVQVSTVERVSVKRKFLLPKIGLFCSASEKTVVLGRERGKKRFRVLWGHNGFEWDGKEYLTLNG